MTRAEMQDLARLRLEEAEVLFVAQKFDGCVYLCGYVVELGLKAAICRTLDINEFPEKGAFKTHDFDDLVLLAGLRNSVSTLTGPPRVNWSFVSKWNSSIRYAPRNSYTDVDAQEWLDALRHPADGVLTWLQTKW